ncbi:flavin reductase family protein [Yinghuangia seranimata]|uniref:flavin reductase family protein n=1 Tax=Yinghuangia seranimata TaxID=408067 RepID=UPI00248A92DC|nr:flavin reductase family protein [Yinghuangia seranimata]MDI2132951.1 flavin reductase family protein [Yinghuangia seranimata]
MNRMSGVGTRAADTARTRAADAANTTRRPHRAEAPGLTRTPNSAAPPGTTTRTPDPAEPPPAATGFTEQHRRALRATLGRFATGVTVVTTTHRGTPVGVTIGSFTSLSLDPPLVLWCLRETSASRPAFTAATHFAVNVLGAHQRDVAERFAGRGDRFHGTATRPGPYGVPLLDGAVAILMCRRRRVLPGGDHVVLIGAVLTFHSTPGPALIFHDGGFLASGPPLEH